MGYYSNSATGPVDLLDKIRANLVTEGWTINLYTAIGAGYRLHVQKTASDATVMYFNFRSAVAETGVTLITEDNLGGANGMVTGILVNGSTGYDAGQVWHKQPGYSKNASNQSFANCMTQMSTTAIPAYYLFAVDDAVHIVVEVTSGKFQFMSFGLLDKSGSGPYPGGQFFTASWPSDSPYSDWNAGWYGPQYFTFNISGGKNGAVYVNMDATASWRVADNQSVREIIFPCVAGQSANKEYSQAGLASMFWAFGPNFYNAAALQTPLHVLGKRSDNNYSLLGHPAGVRFLNVTNYTQGQEIVYGPDTWKVFHADSGNFTPLNMYCGFAFLKVV